MIEPALNTFGFKYSLYDKVGPNPTVDMIDEAAKFGRETGAKAVIGIGGGSPIDTAKSVAVLLEYTDKNARELYELKFTPEKAAPIIAINLTHGTGTEVDRFAVATIPEKNYKPAIAYECLYPMYAIDDPALMIKLDKKQTIAVTIDALNHVTEAATTLVTSPYSILLAKEAVRLIVRYLPVAVNDPENLVARYYLLYASAIAGISFDNGLLHLTHALEHPLSAVKPEIAHGLGLGALLPAVVKTIYPAVAEVLADIYSPIVPGLKGLPAEAEYVAKKVEEWLFNVGCTQKLSDFGFTKDDVPTLVKLAKTTPSLNGLLSIAPVEATETVIAKIYEESLNPIS
ncbi:alcohol dehydrogenase class IV [Caldanaerobacter subterraneus subsp. tengcongensis MB4]|uniref:Alcohol dehydrogenase IV n=1 Tax=Caldanaerobacter subterraneus subsp. tengcongensis (strain DSM 15242 / JCM 11007 / NBRC 100824 / MB4) TaxID=273068 RepID=Q8RBW2_CALS4|nr:Alcohol dehydrogenase IV [Caldanaerobacter subterraneus subsp. tengcongensis MB4]MCS3916525.1 alcohol dehydrogenase class IV [Caldanaerobacter subterraneus subsp. tengcongensis MB4]